MRSASDLWAIWFFNTMTKVFGNHARFFTDPSFFEIFSLPLLKGDSQTVLKEPNTAVLSRNMAQKLFREADPIGKTLRVENHDDFTVTGIMENIPENSHFHFDILMSLDSLEESRIPGWLTLNFPTYLLLKPDADPTALENKLPELVFDRVGAQLEKVTGMSSQLIFQSGMFRFRFFLQPIREIHLHSHLMLEIEPNSDIKYIYIFTAIALFILVIAAINFINLTTARSAGRAKEIGMRKVLGSQRTQLIRQFLTESLLHSCLSMFLALLLAGLFLPLFNHLAQKNLSMTALTGTLSIGVIALIILLTGLLSGIYPALLLSGFNPSRFLKGHRKAGFKSKKLRSALVIFQFSASIILIMGTIVIYRQLSYMQNKRIGYQKEQILILGNAYILKDSIQTFKEDMLNHSDFIQATVSGFLPVPSERNLVTFFPEGDVRSSINVQMWTVDHDYIPTLGMTIREGRNFSPEFSTDGQSTAIINQSLARELEWENPVGKRLTTIISEEGDKATFTVVGMVEDFNFESLRKNISPLLLHVGSSPAHIAFRINTDNVQRSISKLRDKWREFLPAHPFEYFFLDDRFNAVYRSERRVGEISGVFAGLALLIGCLGLLGLAAFTSVQRTKEIGIRKVMGASTGSVMKLLLREYLRLVALANIIAWPVGYYVMQIWIREFAFRASFAAWIPVAAGITALAIALLSVGFQAAKTAVSNPIHSLRYE